ncbi:MULTISPECIES: hypothetical protein [Streptomyces]|uniref:Uncharacterized protein n=2 Tax=Streptomyces TaxID=1883 RepID=A0ABU2RIZ9_9ACTN|nr:MULTISPECIES: hypothetical protein [unclassified Streptomyces]MDT0427439.1 hypothetical protein [Streptomyces sp. DSM 41770]
MLPHQQVPTERAFTGPYGKGGSHRSVAGITAPASLAEVRAHRQRVKEAARRAT